MYLIKAWKRIKHTLNSCAETFVAAVLALIPGTQNDHPLCLAPVRPLPRRATAHKVEEQVADGLEKKIQELPYLDYLRSYAKPGESLIFITPRQNIPPKEIPYLWYLVRKKVNDIRPTLPPGIIGPFFNDEFGDTYSTIYAFSADGFNDAELKDAVDWVRQQLLRIENVEKVDLIGVQEEQIYVEFSDKKFAELGLHPHTKLQFRK